MSNENRVPLVVIILGLLLLASTMFVAIQLVFRDQPDVQNFFSIIWSIALAVLIYQLMVHRSAAQHRSPRRTFYSLARVIFELIAVLTLLFTAVMAVVVLTDPRSNTQLLVLVGITGTLSVMMLLTPRMLKMLKPHDESVSEQEHF